MKSYKKFQFLLKLEINSITVSVSLIQNTFLCFFRQQLFDSGISASHNKAITLLLDSQERVLPQDFVIAENESVRKILSVLVFLCDEVYQLRDIAEGK